MGRREELPPQVKAVVEKVREFLNVEGAQDDMYSSEARRLLADYQKASSIEITCRYNVANVGPRAAGDQRVLEDSPTTPSGCRTLASTSVYLELCEPECTW